MIGNYISAELDKIEGKTAKQVEGRRQAALNRMLGMTPQFKNPVPTK